jgi:tetratricopeptide (TPR) repeat protein
MIEFASEQEYNKTLTHFYLVLAEVDAESPDSVFEAADYLSDQNDPELYEKSIEMMNKVCELYPDDTELAADRNKIQAKKVINKFDKAESQADVLKDKDAAKNLEQESQQIRTDDDLDKAIERAEDRVASNPEDPRAREVMADLLFRKGKLKEAIEQFDKAIELDPNNQNIRARLGDARIEMFKMNATKIEKRIKKTKDPAERKEMMVRLKGTRKKLLDAKLAEFMRRLKVNPNDLKTRYELGVLYFNAKAIDKAIQQFQRSVMDAKLAFSSSLYLGNCFKAKKIYDMAISEFENAGNKPGASQNDRLGVLYETADCYVEMKKLPDALAIYKKILNKDFAFKDVSAKVDEIQNQIDSQ